MSEPMPDVRRDNFEPDNGAPVIRRVDHQVNTGEGAIYSDEYLRRKYGTENGQ